MGEMELVKFLPKDLFDSKVIFITGGGSGINLGIARAFASLGADLVICGLSLFTLGGVYYGYASGG